MDTEIPLQDCDQLIEMLTEKLDSGKIELPMLSEVATRLTQMAQDPDCDLNQFSEILHRDPSLAGNVLRVANSPLYMPVTPIVSLQQAVARLGLKRMRELVMLVTCEATVFQVPGFRQELQDLMRHSVATAWFSQEIARRKRWSKETAFLAGLLHDVGRPVLLQEIVRLRQDGSAIIDRDTVLEVCDRLHAHAGSLLVQRWGLEADLAPAIRWHHDPDGTPMTPPLHALLNLADDLASWALVRHEIDTRDLIHHPTCETLNLYPEDIEEFLSRQEEVRSSVEELV